MSRSANWLNLLVETTKKLFKPCMITLIFKFVYYSIELSKLQYGMCYWGGVYYALHTENYYIKILFQFNHKNFITSCLLVLLPLKHSLLFF